MPWPHALLSDSRIAPSSPTRCSKTSAKKGAVHSIASDPPRRRANKREGRGTMKNARASVVGVVGRETGQIRLAVVVDTQQTTIQPLVENATRSDATVYSDEAGSFAQIGRSGRVHLTVNHG